MIYIHKIQKNFKCPVYVTRIKSLQEDNSAISKVANTAKP
jgi:hypothetical protein